MSVVLDSQQFSSLDMYSVAGVHMLYAALSSGRILPLSDFFVSRSILRILLDLKLQLSLQTNTFSFSVSESHLVHSE